MGIVTAIGWTDETRNLSVGCTISSPACWNCYAAREIDGRFSKNPKSPYFGMSFYDGPVLFPERLLQPFSPAPHRCFIDSYSDLFHVDVPDSFLTDVFRMCERTPHVTFQVLTKRAERLERFMNAPARRADFTVWPLPNVRLGCTVEDKLRLSRIRHLQRAMADCRFLSIEPQLEDLDLRGRLDGIDQVIVGGESGPLDVIRPFRLEWARKIRDACQDANVSFFFKQTGRLCARELGFTKNGADPAEWPDDLQIQQDPDPRFARAA